MRFLHGLLLTLVCLAGCDPTPALFRAVAVGAPIVAGGYRALDAADQMEQAKIRSRAQGGDPEGAKAQLTMHLKRYDKARLALDSTTNAMKTALDSAPLIRAARDKQASAALIGQLLQFYHDVADALLPFGINISLGGI